jgi:hypothetical protein
MKKLVCFRWLPLATIALFSYNATARPLLVPAQQVEFPRAPGVPDGEAFASYYGDAAIDENTLLVEGSRAINAQNERATGVHIMERDATGNWVYLGLLTDRQGDLRIDGSVATVRSEIQEGVRVFERGATGWAQTAHLTNPNLSVVRIEDGSIFTQTSAGVNDPPSCLPPFEEYRKVNGAWTVVATIGGQRCERAELDVNDGRALITYRDSNWPAPQRPAQVFAAGQPAWTLTGTIAQPASGDLGANGTLRGDTAYFGSNYLYRNSGGAWVPSGRLVEPEREVAYSFTGGRLRGNHLFLKGQENDYELPAFDGIEEGWETVRAYRQTAPGKFTYHARLNADASLSRWSVSDDGRQVAATSYGRTTTGYSETARLYVFDVPDTATFPGTRQETFDAGNYASWTVTAGTFGVVTSGASRVLRQSGLAGDAFAHLTAIDWTDQSIEADMRPLEFAQTDRWFGLITRRVDANNYYYVTFRAPNVISLRRKFNGVFTELARTTALGNFDVGRNYRVRLESVGTQHAVFVDGFPLIRWNDDALSHGSPGVAAHRTRFDVDNVVVSSGTRVLWRLDSGRRDWSEGWQSVSSGTWELRGQVPNRYLVQSDPQADARWVSTIGGAYQTVSTRVRPQALGTTSDPSIGLATHYVNDSNYYYLSLRYTSQTLSLRRMVNGQIQVLATVPQAVTLGSWHDLRLEVVGTKIRAYANGDLKIEQTIPALSGSSGRNALLMYKMAADVESYIAYQP